MYHLAQINVAHMLAPLNDPLMAEFSNQLARINTVADASPGFIWRLQSETGDATAVRAYGDELILINISVWESLDALTAYVYVSAHRPVMQRRRQWFARYDGPYMALWWVPQGHNPSVAEAKERLDHLCAHGPTSFAFTFKQPFSAPDGTATRIAPGIEATCGV